MVFDTDHGMILSNPRLIEGGKLPIFVIFSMHLQVDIHPNWCL